MEAYPSWVLHLEPRSFSCGGKGGPETGPKGEGRAVSPGQAPGSTQAAGGVCLPPASPAAPVPRTRVAHWSVQMAGERFTFSSLFLLSRPLEPASGEEQKARLFAGRHTAPLVVPGAWPGVPRMN